ncbi:MAG TPA: hypothetical protein P5205_19660 [Candidatus Paceibacterota bacterium]|nr:hypothetical protein [Verrucomicrobiota bacterium]HSA12583.1 hypothetical protein [Candidatus Paceibacterota bacterium]
MALVLESKVGGDFEPHPEGIHPAICLDVIDLGLVETEWQGVRRWTNKARIVWETEQRTKEGKNCIVTKTFTASLHPKSKLSDFLGKWRGRPVVPGESIDLSKLIGANCTLVISHQQNLVGRTYASIDAISKPSKRLVPSGSYDPALARQRIAEWKAREAGQAQAGGGGRPLNPVGAAFPQQPAQPAPKSPAPVAAPAAPADFDPEVGF